MSFYPGIEYDDTRRMLEIVLVRLREIRNCCSRNSSREDKRQRSRAPTRIAFEDGNARSIDRDWSHVPISQRFTTFCFPAELLDECANAEYRCSRIVKRFAISIAIHEVPRDSPAEEPR